MRPHLLYLTLLLFHKGVRKFDVLYSEPQRYSKKENTTFSEGTIHVRQVDGYVGLNSTAPHGDFLIIGSGYDDRLIKAVANEKDKADKVQIFGLPSLRADMYQENVLRAHRAEEAVGRDSVVSMVETIVFSNEKRAEARSRLHLIGLDPSARRVESSKKRLWTLTSAPSSRATSA